MGVLHYTEEALSKRGEGAGVYPIRPIIKMQSATDVVVNRTGSPYRCRRCQGRNRGLHAICNLVDAAWYDPTATPTRE